MFRKSSAILLVAAFLEALPASVGGFYTKNSPVLQVDENNYDNLIAKSNHVSVSFPRASEVNAIELTNPQDRRVRFPPP